MTKSTESAARAGRAKNTEGESPSQQANPYMVAPSKAMEEHLWTFAPGTSRYSPHSICGPDGVVIDPLPERSCAGLMVPVGYLVCPHDNQPGIPNPDRRDRRYQSWLQEQMRWLDILNRGLPSLPEKMEPVIKELAARVVSHWQVLKYGVDCELTADTIRRSEWLPQRLGNTALFGGWFRGERVDIKELFYLVFNLNHREVWCMSVEEQNGLIRSIYQADPIEDDVSSGLHDEVAHLDLSAEGFAQRAVARARKALCEAEAELVHVQAANFVGKVPDLLGGGREFVRFHHLKDNRDAMGLIPHPASQIG